MNKYAVSMVFTKVGASSSYRDVISIRHLLNTFDAVSKEEAIGKCLEWCNNKLEQAEDNDFQLYTTTCVLITSL